MSRLPSVCTAFAFLVGLCGACSSTIVAPGASTPTVDAGSEASMGVVPDTCGAGAPSKCRPANAASVLRGIAHFDPAKFSGGPDGGDAVPRLAIFLAHRQYAQIPEHALGGHPHADKIMENIDVTKGEIHFAIDLCEHGVAMWTEDNCDFNLILILDKNGNNGPDLTSINMVPDKGELSKMTTVQFSCRGTSACMDINLDCADGQRCVNYDTPSTCACAAESCNSDSVTCR